VDTKRAATSQTREATIARVRSKNYSRKCRTISRRH
jgi:hypothetical protein